LLAVKPDGGQETIDTLVDATGTRRRLQALVVAGWSERALADAAWLPPTRLRLIASGARPEVTAATARRVVRLYNELWDQAPAQRTRGERISAAMARAFAAAHGWAPAMAWDDETIDDPRARPQGVPARHMPRAEPAQVGHRRSHQGTPPHGQIAGRSGVTGDAPGEARLGPGRRSAGAAA
jgi:hypothetical protein